MLAVACYEEGIIGVKLRAEYGEADFGGEEGGSVVIDRWGRGGWCGKVGYY